MSKNITSIISEWNALPERAVKATSINSFKQAIQPYLNDVRGLHMSQRRLPAPILKRPPYTNEAITPVDQVSYPVSSQRKDSLTYIPELKVSCPFWTIFS